MSNLEGLILYKLIDEPEVFKEINARVETFLDNYNVASWLTKNQAMMLSEILLSGRDMEKRFKEYKILALSEIPKA